MDWTALGAVGDLIGGTAVVISIVYLALQIRQQNVQAKLAASRASQQSLQASTFGMITADNRAVLMKGCASYLRLSNAEKWAFHGLMLNVFFDFNLSLQMHRQGVFADEDLRIHEQWLADLLVTPGGREYWVLEEHWLNAPAKAAIDQLIARGIGRDFRLKLGMSVDE